MGNRALTEADRDHIVSEYKRWTGTTDSLVRHLEISRHTLYNTLRAKGIPTATVMRARAEPDTGRELADGMAREALTVLLEELVKARVEIARLTRLLDARE
jgi:hypothetical protein